jgi:hypothetical protein
VQSLPLGLTNAYRISARACVSGRKLRDRGQRARHRADREQRSGQEERRASPPRQLASRARRRVRGAREPDAASLAQQRKVVEAFLAASRNGDFEALLEVLDPDVVLFPDRVVSLVAFTIVGDRVTEMDLLVDPVKLRQVRVRGA